MSGSVNKVILVGRCGQDPEVRQISNGGSVTNISLATSDSWRDKQTGERRERTEWHRVVFFGKLAEIAGQYLHKGSQVYVEGRLQTRKWQDQNGMDRYSTEVVVDMNGQMQMLGSRGEGQGGYDSSAMSAPASAPAAPQAPQQPMAGGASAEFDDDIPF